MLFSNKTKIITLIAIIFLAGFAITVYIYSGKLLFGNIIHTTQTNTLSDKMQNHNIPEFYRTLSKGKGNFSIIEYPAIVQDRFNPFPYYQSYHQKKILNGYFLSHALKKQWKIKNIFETNVWPVEIILSSLENNKINLSKVINIFPDFVDLHNIHSIRNSGAKYIILHKIIKDEIIAVKNDPQVHGDVMKGADSIKIWRHVYRFSFHLKEYYRRYFGEPVYENNLLIVFKVDQLK